MKRERERRERRGKGSEREKEKGKGKNRKGRVETKYPITNNILYKMHSKAEKG
jgi:hypothetical protein